MAIELEVNGARATVDVDAAESAARTCAELGAPTALARTGGVWMLEDWAFC